MLAKGSKIQRENKNLALQGLDDHIQWQPHLKKIKHLRPIGNRNPSAIDHPRACAKVDGAKPYPSLLKKPRLQLDEIDQLSLPQKCNVLFCCHH